MLSYQHSYHAGCFADVIKHFVLTRLFTYMTQKDKPLLYLDTHSGRGLYDLQDAHALKTNEAEFGIRPVWNGQQALPIELEPYLHAIRAVNTEGELRRYPGSPALAIDFLRAQDRLVFCERHDREFQHLTHLSRRKKRVTLLHDDGLVALNALVPPIERRGLIFIDPAYEVKTEYRDIAQAVKKAHQRFATGVYCIWYPILSDTTHLKQLFNGLKSMTNANHLQVTFESAVDAGMSGCGLWIINPPYLLARDIEPGLKAFTRLFNPGVSRYRIDTPLSS